MDAPPTHQKIANQSGTSLVAGNSALRIGNYAEAVSHYMRALQQTPALEKIIAGNLKIVQHKNRGEHNIQGLFQLRCPNRPVVPIVLRNDRENNILIVTGLGRCGTSVITKYINSLGYDSGGKWIDKYDAGMEHPSAVKINDLLLEMGGTGIKNQSEQGKEFLRDFNPKVVKDPRFMYKSAVCLKEWCKQKSNVKVLICHRDFYKMYNSRKSKMGINDAYLPENIDVWKKDFADTITFLINTTATYCQFQPTFS